MKSTASGRRQSGLVVPLSAIRSDASSGCGEYPDLRRLGDLASIWGFQFIQLLPINDSGFQNSPYSALSAFALHPLYIRIGDLPELGSEKAPMRGDRAQEAAAIEGLRVESEALMRRYADFDRVQYEALLKEKIELLRKIWNMANLDQGSVGRTLAEELDNWIADNDWCKSYAAFIVLKSRNGERPWWEWPRLREPADADIESLWRDGAIIGDLHFWSWLQMRAAQQLREAVEYLNFKGIALVGDIPILMNKDSVDVWSRRRFFDLELIAGAPPDMYASMGQNWGFPVYDWNDLESDDYSFWIERLREASKYYSCYRIDHVLGFFRIWSLSDRESTGFLGRFVPSVPIRWDDLMNLGLSPERVRWLSSPHLPTWRLVQAAGESAARGAASAALERIGVEDLFLFKESVRGEKDIEALPSISPAARDCLLEAWRDRALFEYQEGLFSPTWNYRSTTSWASLSDDERGRLESLLAQKAAESEELWANTGERLLGVLTHAVSMVPCAEDLGSVPDCVPRVLDKLGILGLRVLRWTRQWQEGGQPHVPIADYPELSVACPSVHDSSSIREWWEVEADREGVWRFATSSLGRDLGACPERLGTEHVAIILELIAKSASRMAAYPIQDILAMSESLRPADPRSERINVPGTVGSGNWSYRVPATIDAILVDKALTVKACELAKARTARKLKSTRSSQ
jgi:4-alpha-glucanotransferase